MTEDTLRLIMTVLGVFAWLVLLYTSRNNRRSPLLRHLIALLVGMLIATSPFWLQARYPADPLSNLLLRAIALAMPLFVLGLWLLRKRSASASSAADRRQSVAATTPGGREADTVAARGIPDQDQFDAAFDKALAASGAVAAAGGSAALAVAARQHDRQHRVRMADADDPRADLPEARDWVESQPDPESFLEAFSQEVITADDPADDTAEIDPATMGLSQAAGQIYDAGEIERDARQRLLRQQQARAAASQMGAAIGKLEGQLDELEQRHDADVAKLHERQLALDEYSLMQRQKLREGEHGNTAAEQQVILHQQRLLQQRRDRSEVMQLQLRQARDEAKRLRQALERARSEARQALLLSRQAVAAEKLSRLRMQREQNARRLHQRATHSALSIARKAVAALAAVE